MAAQADAALCRKKSGALVIKPACTGKLQLVTPGDLGAGAAAGGGLELGASGFAITAGGVTSELLADGAVTPAKLGAAPAARVFHSAAQSAANVPTFTVLTFDSERFDTASLHSTSVDASRLTAPIAGLYLVSANVSWSGTSDVGAREVGLRKNGSTFVARDVVDPSVSANTTEQTVSTLVSLAADDFLEVVLRQNSGGALDVNAAPEFSPEFSMIWLGPST